jgi:hypothetical protein
MQAEQAHQPIVDTKNHRIAHIGVVVRDAVKSAKQYAKIFGIGPWMFFDSLPTEATFHGDPIKDNEACVRLALANLGDIEFELLQPLYGPSSHMEFLKTHGEGIHHLSFSEIEGCAAVVSALTDYGIHVEMQGIASDVIPFTYMATQDKLGTIFELPDLVSPDLREKVKPWGLYEPEEQGVIDLEGKKIAQVGIVVADAEQIARNYWEIFGIGPWLLFDFKPPMATGDCLHGIPVAEGTDFLVKAAMADYAGLQIELLEPVYGSSTHMEFLKTHGQGVHHISFDIVNDHDALVSAMASAGIEIEMSGIIGGSHRFTYLATQDSLSTVLECVKEDPRIESTAMPYGTYPPSP